MIFQRYFTKVYFVNVQNVHHTRASLSFESFSLVLIILQPPYTFTRFRYQTEIACRNISIFLGTNLVLFYFLDQYPGARRPRTQELPFNFLIFKIASLSQPFCELLIFSREIYSLTSSIRQLFFFSYNKHRDFFSFSRKVLFNEIPVLISVNISLRYNFLIAFK